MPHPMPFEREPAIDVARIERKPGMTREQWEEFYSGLARYCKAYGCKLIEFCPEEILERVSGDSGSCKCRDEMTPGIHPTQPECGVTNPTALTNFASGSVQTNTRECAVSPNWQAGRPEMRQELPLSRTSPGPLAETLSNPQQSLQHHRPLSQSPRLLRPVSFREVIV